MAGNNQGDDTTTGLIAGILIAGLIAVAFIGWGLWQSAEYEREANNHTREYAAYTDKKIRHACNSLVPIKKQDCSAQARQEQRDNERNERDLVAQRQSALWAYIMGAAAVIGMWLSVIGVFLVWTTFKSTAEANALLKGQLYPVLAFNASMGGLREKDNGSGQVWFSAKVENKGLTPARELSGSWHFQLLAGQTLLQEVEAASSRIEDIEQGDPYGFGSDTDVLVENVAATTRILCTLRYSYETIYGTRGSGAAGWEATLNGQSFTWQRTAQPQQG